MTDLLCPNCFQASTWERMRTWQGEGITMSPTVLTPALRRALRRVMRSFLEPYGVFRSYSRPGRYPWGATDWLGGGSQTCVKPASCNNIYATGLLSLADSQFKTIVFPFANLPMGEWYLPIVAIYSICNVSRPENLERRLYGAAGLP